MNHEERFLNDPIPLASKTNLEIENLVREVWEEMQADGFKGTVLWEVIRRLKQNPSAVRKKQKAKYKFRTGDIIEVRTCFSPRFGVNLQGSWRVMKIMGFQYLEPRLCEYYALPIDDLNSHPQHYWNVYEEDMRIALNPRCD